MMFTVNRRPGHPIDRGIDVFVDLPHAAETAARPFLCSVMTADTHEPITGVLGISMHFDSNPTPGNHELWIVAEQIVDEDYEPVPVGAEIGPQYHHEYFSGTLRTALFRYRVAGFTTGPTFDRSATWHRDVSDNVAVPANSSADVTVFDVHLRNHLRERVAAHRFEIRDGFVTFLADNARQVASFSIQDVTRIVSGSDLKPLVVNPEQLRVLRSAVLWDVDRTSASTQPSEYRERVLDVLVNVLGMMPPEYRAAAEQPDSDEDDADVPNERTRTAAHRLDELVKAV